MCALFPEAVSEDCGVAWCGRRLFRTLFFRYKPGSSTFPNGHTYYLGQYISSLPSPLPYCGEMGVILTLVVLRRIMDCLATICDRKFSPRSLFSVDVVVALALKPFRGSIWASCPTFSVSCCFKTSHCLACSMWDGFQEAASSVHVL